MEEGIRVRIITRAFSANVQAVTTKHGVDLVIVRAVIVRAITCIRLCKVIDYFRNTATFRTMGQHGVLSGRKVRSSNCKSCIRTSRVVCV